MSLVDIVMSYNVDIRWSDLCQAFQYKMMNCNVAS